MGEGDRWRGIVFKIQLICGIGKSWFLFSLALSLYEPVSNLPFLRYAFHQMKKTVSLFLLVFMQFALHAQTGTIKVAKRTKPTRADTTIGPFLKVFQGLSFYTCLSHNTKRFKDPFGLDAGFYVTPAKYFRLGLELSRVEQRYELGGWDPVRSKQSDPVPLAAMHLLFLKMPVGLVIPFASRMTVSPGVAPSLLLTARNDNGRIGYAQLYNLNIGWFISLEYAVSRGRMKHLTIVGLRVTGDFQPNLKDNGIYATSGALLHSQNSRNYLVEFEVRRIIGR
jgi:hypothetical protein